MNDPESLDYTYRGSLSEAPVISPNVGHAILKEMPNPFSENFHSDSVQMSDNRALPHFSRGDGVRHIGTGESYREDNDGTSFTFCCPLSCDPSSTLTQFPSAHYPDYFLPPSSTYLLNPMSSLVNNTCHSSVSSSWTPEATVRGGMLSSEICNAVASISSENTEEYTKEAYTQESPAEFRHHGQWDLCPPANTPLAVFLPPFDHMGEKHALQTPNYCQVLCNTNGEGHMVLSQHVTSSQGNMPEHGRPHLEDIGQPLSSRQKRPVPSPGPGQGLEGGPYLTSLGFSSIQPGQSYIHPSPLIPPPLYSSGLAFNLVSGQYVSQFHQTHSPLNPDPQSVASDGPPKGSRSCGSYLDRLRKPCNCTKSQCLKLYCDCFANGEVCSNCNCVNCYNNAEHDTERYKAIKVYLDRNPEAFRPKIGNGRLEDLKVRHNKGCNCKRSSCLKNYCECYEAKIMCSSACKCVGCLNYEQSPGKRATDWDSPNTTYCKKADTQKSKCPLKCITADVVEATCGCLLAQAEEAEKEGYTLSQAERMILEEFGQCLTQIVRSIFKSSCVQV